MRQTNTTVINFMKKLTKSIFYRTFSKNIRLVWWVCVCRSKCVSGTDNPLTSSGTLCRVSSFTFDTCRILLFPDAFSKEALIPTCSPRSEFAVTLVTSHPEDAFRDLIANSILGATTLSIAVKITFCILSSTVSTTFPCQSSHWNIFPKF